MCALAQWRFEHVERMPSVFTDACAEGVALAFDDGELFSDLGFAKKDFVLRFQRWRDLCRRTHELSERARVLAGAAC